MADTAIYILVIALIIVALIYLVRRI